MTTTQRAVLIRACGGAAAAEVAEIAKPAAGQGQVLVPQGLDDVHAAGIPVAAVAAWHSLHHADPITAGQRILIHGAAGGLGGYAVQYARRAGAEVFATASTATSADILARTPPGRRGLWFVNKPDAPLLERLAAEIAQGTLISRLSDVVGFNDIPTAIERNRTGPRIGKVVADFCL